MRKVLKVVLIVFVAFVVFMISGIVYLQFGQKETNKTVINNVDLSLIEDGKYIGEFQGYRWSNKVEVTVINHEITDIRIIEDLLFVKEGISEQLFTIVIEEQSLDVDVVSTATITSKAYLKAIENALSK